MADADPLSDNSQLSQATTSSAIPSGRMALLFTVMLVTAAGNTAMQSVMPSIGSTRSATFFMTASVRVVAEPGGNWITETKYP